MGKIQGAIVTDPEGLYKESNTIIMVYDLRFERFTLKDCSQFTLHPNRVFLHNRDEISRIQKAL